MESKLEIALNVLKIVIIVVKTQKHVHYVFHMQGLLLKMESIQINARHAL